jgi:hypothetical protein
VVDIVVAEQQVKFRFRFGFLKILTGEACSGEVANDNGSGVPHQATKAISIFYVPRE